MNFDCSIFPDCRLWIENSVLFHHLSSAWIPQDIKAAMAAYFGRISEVFSKISVILTEVEINCKLM